MADWLLLRLPRTAQAEASWILADARGNPLSAPQTGPLELAAQRVAGRHVCVVVPGTDVLLTEPELPAKAGAKLQQIVPLRSGRTARRRHRRSAFRNRQARGGFTRHSGCRRRALVDG
ncbi:MAG: type II secretion system protein GspL [Gammaproteobacteria bacterium]